LKEISNSRIVVMRFCEIWLRLGPNVFWKGAWVRSGCTRQTIWKSVSFPDMLVKAIARNGATQFSKWTGWTRTERGKYLAARFRGMLGLVFTCYIWQFEEYGTTERMTTK
jgi:hypothetical protein